MQIARRVHQAGTALIETAIVLPVYMIVLFGLMYFGYVTLGHQRQDKATAYAAWAPGTQPAGPLVEQFWAWNAPLNAGPNNSVSFNWASTSPQDDATFSVYSGTANGSPDWIRKGDEYYGMTINGGGTGIFDSARLAVDLWNYALGTPRQSFTWTPGQGVVPQVNVIPTPFSAYLNNSGIMQVPQSLNAPPPSPNLASPQGWGGILANALNAPPTGGQWLQRRAVESQTTYLPPFLRYAYADPGAPPSSFGQFLSGNAVAPTLPPVTMDCDVTVRNTASLRQGAEEGGQNPATFLNGVGLILGANGTLQPPLPDTLPLDANGNTIAYWATPH
jgi:hypothetical protein